MNERVPPAAADTEVDTDAANISSPKADPVAAGKRAGQTTGIILLLTAILLFTLMDATAKYLSAHYETLQIVWSRFTVNLLIVLVLFAPRLRQVIATKQPGVQAMRGLTQLASSILFFSSLAYIGLAEATAIMDINPVLITLGAALFLGESIGIRRILGILAALLGALIIIRPGAGVFHPAAILPLLGAFSYAGGALLTRVARADSTATSVLWSALVGTVLTSFALPFVWSPIQPEHIWAFITIGILGTLAQSLLIRAFSVSEAGAIAPFGYTGLIWAGIWGWLFWGALPDKWTVLGAIIIVLAGIYVWTREARAMKQAR